VSHILTPNPGAPGRVLQIKRDIAVNESGPHVASNASTDRSRCDFANKHPYVDHHCYFDCAKTFHDIDLFEPPLDSQTP
jgi:hypothetical protein